MTLLPSYKKKQTNILQIQQNFLNQSKVLYQTYQAIIQKYKMCIPSQLHSKYRNRLRTKILLQARNVKHGSPQFTMKETTSLRLFTPSNLQRENNEKSGQIIYSKISHLTQSQHILCQYHKYAVPVKHNHHSIQHSKFTSHRHLQVLNNPMSKLALQNFAPQIQDPTGWMSKAL